MIRAEVCATGCQYAKDVGMPEFNCGGECQYGSSAGGVNKAPPPLDPSHVASPDDTKAPWTECPECGVGKGIDHKRGCLRGHWKHHSKGAGLSEEEVEKIKGE